MSSMRSLRPHQRLHGREVERALLHVVEQATGRGDQDVERAREAIDLRLHATPPKTTVDCTGVYLP